MPEEIRAYITTDGREVPRLGTFVRESEALHFSNLPPGIVPYLGPRGKVKVRFVTSGHVCDFDDPLSDDLSVCSYAAVRHRLVQSPARPSLSPTSDSNSDRLSKFRRFGIGRKGGVANA